MTTTDKKLLDALRRETLRVKAKIEASSESEAEVRELLCLYFLLEVAMLRLRKLLDGG
jgi:hypothetical protein